MSEACVRELFVWYRVDDRNVEPLHAEVVALQRSLEQRFAGLRARLLIRRGAERQTWMEMYSCSPCSAGDDAGIDAAIETAISTTAERLRRLLASDRHVEAFEVVRAARSP